jgi:sec-independent protein translocase protein TatB
MFDIGGVEILVIAVVAILVVGPKDLPGLLRGIGRVTRQARAMLSDVQRQFHDALDEADMGDVRQTFSDMKELSPRQQIVKGLKKQIEPHQKELDDIEHSLHHALDGPSPKAAKSETPALAQSGKGDDMPVEEKTLPVKTKKGRKKAQQSKKS